MDFADTVTIIKNLYNAKCGGDIDIDKCNCFLHSFTVLDKSDHIDSDCDSIDEFTHLIPFIKYIYSVHDSNNKLDLKTVKSYASKFTDPNIEFNNLS